MILPFPTTNTNSNRIGSNRVSISYRMDLSKSVDIHKPLVLKWPEIKAA